uniref:Uncharacterized protein n=1 Tax=Octopus bimaculoides TaxID=37653 RepID=A0A0L8H951_OCTBM
MTSEKEEGEKLERISEREGIERIQIGRDWKREVLKYKERERERERERDRERETETDRATDKDRQRERERERERERRTNSHKVTERKRGERGKV